MTRKEALQALLAKVEAGEADHDFYSHVFSYAATSDQYRLAWWFRESFEGSLDAAKALHEAVLPGWPWCVKTLATDAVQVWTNRAYSLRHPGCIGTTKDNPARAWLIAILRALIAQEDGE